MLWLGEKEHFTFQFGSGSGILDLHKTEDKTKKHHTLWAARRQDFFDWIKRIGRKDFIWRHIVPLYRPVSLQWLFERQAWLIPISDLDIPRFVKLAAQIEDEDAFAYRILEDLLILPADLLCNRLIENKEQKYAVLLWRDGELQVVGTLFQAVQVDRPRLFLVRHDEMMGVVEKAWNNWKSQLSELHTPRVVEELKTWLNSQGRIGH